MSAEVTSGGSSLPPVNIALNSGSLSPTEVQFAEAMQRAESFFVRLGTATIAEKDKMIEELNIAWKCLESIRAASSSDSTLLKKQSISLARITLLWGQCRWCSVDMEISRQVFSLSLMYARGQVDQLPLIKGDSLVDYLRRLASDSTTFNQLDDELTRGPQIQDLVREALDGGEKRALAIADAARQLGGTFQNHTSYNRIKEDDTPLVKETKVARCRNVISFAEGIWKILDTPETRWALITCKYNTGPFLFSLTDKSPIGAAKIVMSVLEDIEKLIKSGDTSVRLFQQKAQCLNKMAIEQKSFLAPAQIFQLTSTAAELADQYADKGFDVFLARLFLNNRAKSAFNSIKEGHAIEGITIEKVQQWMTRTIDLCERHQFSHYYDAIFCLNAAEIAKYNSSQENAIKYALKALEICMANPSSSADIKASVLEFCIKAQIVVPKELV